VREPIDHRAVGGEARQATQPGDQQVMGEIAQIFNAAGTDDEQPDCRLAPQATPVAFSGWMADGPGSQEPAGGS
jgi:hypothetical protein